MMTGLEIQSDFRLSLLIKSLSCEVILEFGCIAIVAVGPEMILIAGLVIVPIE